MHALRARSLIADYGALLVMCIKRKRLHETTIMHRGKRDLNPFGPKWTIAEHIKSLKTHFEKALSLANVILNKKRSAAQASTFIDFHSPK